MYTTLVDPKQLQTLFKRQAHTPVLVFDCSFDLADASKADAMFLEKHIAASRQAHLERDLSAAAAASDAPPGGAAAVNGGRHPLPQRKRLAQWLRAQGMQNNTQVVAYDRNDSSFSARLWWMLKWLGHDAVAVLDGGLAAWEEAGGALQQGPAAAVQATGGFTLGEPRRRLVLTDEVAQNLGRPSQTVVDARATPRFKGDVEPLDPVAGHIPGALNRPYTDNFCANGRFKSAVMLKAEWAQLLAGRDIAHVVHHCGSGVTATPNILAMEIAGFAPVVGFYAGGWSEWCRHTPSLPCARG
ncbi:MAG: sulfurtransferase [Burkholderiaceae bacterium]|jgi:thiosulfate/3-mercaptopyruvate sulfurtransferase|nr:sulfurtransferase [Burkholderiaceae bacterium]